MAQHLRIDPPAGEITLAFFIFSFEPHAGPHVGRDEIGAVACGVGIGEEAEMARVASPCRGPYLVAGRGRDMHAEAQERRRLQPGATDIVGIADPRDGSSRNRAAVLDISVDVGKDLAGVVFVGEAVDHRHARVRGEALDDRLLEGANHHHVDHPRYNACEILDRLAARKLRVAAVQIDRDPAELVHAGFERHAGARRRLLEYHRQCAVTQRLVELVTLEALLDPAGTFEQVIELVPAEILELQEMLGRHAYDRGGSRAPGGNETWPLNLC